MRSYTSDLTPVKRTRDHNKCKCGLKKLRKAECCFRCEVVDDTMQLLTRLCNEGIETPRAVLEERENGA